MESKAVVGGLVVLNIASKFKSPLRSEVVPHRNIERIVRETVQMFDELPRATPQGGRGLDALGIIVINHTNIPADTSMLVKNPPAPQLENRTHYRRFLQDTCDALSLRFLKI